MKNYNLKLKIKLLLLVTGCLLLPIGVGATVLYLEPSTGEYQLGETFIEEIRIDTEKECINAVGVDLSFSQDTLEAVDFSQGNSILTLWVKTPSINQESGLISFAGGIPGGYCGEVPGAPAESNLLGRIIFKVKDIEGLTLEEARFGEEQPWARIKFLDSSQVLLNDGKGTPARLTKKGAVFAISAREITEKLRAVIGPDIWQQELEKDNIPPEEFLPEITRDPAIFEGKYFLTFSATDKQTGVDYYQVSEQKRIAFIVLGREEWKEAKSPYLLEDQGLRSIIKVKAVDEAGNERIEVIIPKVGWQDILPWVILVLIVGVVIWWIVRKCRKK
jgi:hypothetical protein